MSVERPSWDDAGSRWAKCSRCGMGWFEHREPVELLPGQWTTTGERPHSCPDPMPYHAARAMVELAQARGGIVVSQRMKAAIKLGLGAGP